MTDEKFKALVAILIVISSSLLLAPPEAFIFESQGIGVALGTWIIVFIFQWDSILSANYIATTNTKTSKLKAFCWANIWCDFILFVFLKFAGIVSHYQNIINANVAIFSATILPLLLVFIFVFFVREKKEA